MTNPTSKGNLTGDVVLFHSLVVRAIELLGALALKERQGFRLSNQDTIQMYDRLFEVLEQVSDLDYNRQLASVEQASGEG